MALTDNLRAAYNFDNSSGLLEDSTANGYDLTNTNSVAAGTGKINQAADTGSSNTNKNLATSSFLGLTASSPYTFNVWLNVTTQPTSGNEALVLSWCDNSTTNGKIYYQLKLYNNAGTMQVYITRNNSSTQDQVGANQTFTLGTWYMLTYRWNGSTQTLCVDGNTTPLLTQASTIVGTNTSNGGTDGLKFFVNQESSGHLSGLIDIGLVWNRAISDSEMGELYNSGAGVQYPFSSAYDETYTETLTLVDTIIKAPSRILADVMTLVDTVTGLKIINQVLSEVMTLVDTIERATSAVRTETMTLVDTIPRAVSRALADVMTLVDTITSAHSMIRTLTETMTLVDSFLVNGSNVIWAKISKSAEAVWTKIVRS